MSYISVSFLHAPSQWGFWVKFISTPIIVYVGILGNGLSLVVMKTKNLRHKSYSLYLCALAVFDTLTLIAHQIENVDDYFVHFKAEPGLFQHFNSASCKTYNFFSHIITLISSWLVVFMALERLIAVCFPFKRVILQKPMSAVKLICTLIVVACISQSFRIVMVDHILYDTENGIWDCQSRDEYAELYTSLEIFFFQWSLVFFLPVTLIICFNSLVLYQIFKVKREFYRHENNYRKYRHGKITPKKHRSTCMLLAVTFTYILTLLPLFTLSVIVEISIKVGPLDTARYIFFSLQPYIDLCASISLLNYAVNFFIYVLSGKHFRYELVKCCRENNQHLRSSTPRSTREELIRLSTNRH